MISLGDFKIELYINEIENKLSEISFYPIIGTVSGATKIILGVIQMVALPIIFAVHALCSHSKNFHQSLLHFKHGAGNILAGILESIPGIQTILFNHRQARLSASDHRPIYIHTFHENKFMPYEDLVDSSCQFAGTSEDALVGAKKFYAEMPTHYPSIYERRRAAILNYLATT